MKRTGLPLLAGLPLHTQGLPSLLDVKLINGHLLLDGTWSTHTTFWSNHLLITISLSKNKAIILLNWLQFRRDKLPLFMPGQDSYIPLRSFYPSPWKARLYTNFRKADWERFTAEAEEICQDPSSNLLLCWGKCLPVDDRQRNARKLYIVQDYEGCFLRTIELKIEINNSRKHTGSKEKFAFICY